MKNENKIGAIEMICLVLFSTLIVTLDLIYRKINSFVSLKQYINGFSLYPVYLLILAIIIFIAYKTINKRSFKEHGVDFKINDLRDSFVFFTLIFPFALLGRLVDPGFDLWYAEQNSMMGLIGVLMFIVVMMLFVFKEEVIERLLLQSRLSKAYGGALTALILSINFAIMHYFNRTDRFHAAMMVVFVFFGSSIVALLFEKTKSLFSTIILHILSNSAVAFQIYFHATKNYSAEVILWVLWGVLFIFFANKSIGYAANLFKAAAFPKLKIKDIIFLLLFSLGIPLCLLVFF